ncbi:hypothetical protein CDAR_5361 [Caerostris darwini]|uniref:Uncharacterized protein n=1 Tax=Caerostris darwini TaxID=1538125 RepID=A0AAV4R7M7_9ARAC|nr:hypothetical protein CDAR_5361 [Caerostris darwini]
MALHDNVLQNCFCSVMNREIWSNAFFLLSPGALQSGSEHQRDMIQKTFASKSNCQYEKLIQASLVPIKSP